MVFCIMGIKFLDYDIYVNFLGGGLIDGFFVGIVMAVGIFFVIYCIFIDYMVVMMGEISLIGFVKFIGGVILKIKVVKQVGVKMVIIFYENQQFILK